MLATLINPATVTAIDRSKPLILITGSFDLLHTGHIRMFTRAKQEVDGDANLFVVILDDSNIKERKGSGRPLQSLDERLFAVRSLRTVDYVMPWVSHWSGLRQFVRGLKPDYLIGVEGDSGLDNKSRLIAETGGTFLLLKRDPRFSTTALLEKIRNLSDEEL